VRAPRPRRVTGGGDDDETVAVRGGGSRFRDREAEEPCCTKGYNRGQGGVEGAAPFGNWRQPAPGVDSNRPVQEAGHVRALTWQGTQKVSVETVPESRIQEPTDAIVRMTSTAIRGSDLHLYDVLGRYLRSGDILGHEPMGIVDEVGAGHPHPAR